MIEIEAVATPTTCKSPGLYNRGHPNTDKTSRKKKTGKKTMTQLYSNSRKKRMLGAVRGVWPVANRAYVGYERGGFMCEICAND